MPRFPIRTPASTVIPHGVRALAPLLGADVQASPALAAWRGLATPLRAVEVKADGLASCCPECLALHPFGCLALAIAFLALRALGTFASAACCTLAALEGRLLLLGPGFLRLGQGVAEVLDLEVTLVAPVAPPRMRTPRRWIPRRGEEVDGC